MCRRGFSTAIANNETGVRRLTYRIKKGQGPYFRSIRFSLRALTLPKRDVCTCGCQPVEVP